MKRFESKFAFICQATRSKKNQKTVVFLTANLNVVEVKYLVDFFKEKVKVKFIKEHEIERYDKKKLEVKEYGFLIDSANPAGGAKGNKTYTIIMSKLLDVKEHKELDDFLTQNVIIEIEKIQPDIDFEKNENEIEIEEPEDPEDSDDED